MDQNEIVSGNRAIAEFMGYKIDMAKTQRHLNITAPGQQDWYFASVFIEDFNEHLTENIKYHSSWDWLMPVVERIESLNNYNVTKVWVGITGQKCDMWTYVDPVLVLRMKGIGRKQGDQWYFRENSGTKIDNVWRACVKFAKWYNSLNQ